jgi:bacterioferritin
MAANLGSPALDGYYPFLSEVAEMRRRARRHIESGSIDSILNLLNEALITELVCVARYRNHWSVLAGIAEGVRGEFLKYAQEEQGHADLLAERILQLGGRPMPSPLAPIEDAAQALPADDGSDDPLAELLEEDLIAEGIAIESYREILQFIGTADPSTRRLLESILAVELTHAQELAGMRAEALRRERVSGATSTRLARIEIL